MKCLKVELVIPLCYQGACAAVPSSEHKGEMMEYLICCAGFCLHVFKLTAAAQGMSFVYVELFESGVPVGSQCMYMLRDYFQQSG